MPHSSRSLSSVLNPSFEFTAGKFPLSRSGIFRHQLPRCSNQIRFLIFPLFDVFLVAEPYSIITNGRIPAFFHRITQPGQTPHNSTRQCTSP
jgi:hypothetical protein